MLSPAATLSDLSGRFFLNALGIVLVPTRPTWICRALLAWSTERPVDEDLMAQWIAGVRGIRILGPIQKIPPLVLTDEELRSIRPPALLLMGGKEWTCRDPKGGLERFRKLVPQGEAAMIDDAGHIVSMDRPEVVSSRILEHLDGSRGGRPLDW